ncbi:MAG: hypothetical protein ACXABY_00595 [Candidatus Thorarchaeota archaeon]|jgi:hypothetical protein
MSTRIEGVCAGIPEEKRCYLPGIKIYSDCPDCGEECLLDLADQYLSYGSTTVTMYCSEETEEGYCGAEWSFEIDGEIRIWLVKEEDD